MAKRKSPEDLEWEHIFSALEFDTEPDPKYIKQAVIETKTGKRFRLSGSEFHNVMMQEREMGPEHGVVTSCKITLDFQKLKADVDKFAITMLTKLTKQHAQSKAQLKRKRALNQAPKRGASSMI
jgi:hypothetical protein